MQSQPDDSTLKPLRFTDLLFAPIGCLIQSSPVFILVLVIIGAVIGTFVYNNVNTDLWGFAAPDFDNFTVMDGYQTIQSDQNQTWQITFEYLGTTRFSGLVRHATPIREGKFPMLTHDILVTSGDFADSSKVKTSVINHKFTWFCDCDPYPSGKINLLHTVPASEEIYKQLLQIRSGDMVNISGREILKIDTIKPDGSSGGWWQDSGCNTLLVQSVEILDKEVE